MTSTVTDLLNAPHEIEYVDERGVKTVYRLKMLNKGQEARYSRWLEKRARDDAARAIAEMPSDAGEVYAAGTRQDIAAGVYEWGSAACVKALQSPAGQQYAIYLTLQDEHPDVDEELAAKIYAQRRQQVIDALTRAVESEDPKVLEVVRKLVNLREPPSQSSATPRTTGNRGNLKKRHKNR